MSVQRFGTWAEEATLSLHLPSEVRWCTPPLELPAESRLRIEALALGRAAQLHVSWLAERRETAWETSAEASGARSCR